MPGTLFIVATPIGNPEDITLRALRVLRDADLIAAEDTRVTALLLAQLDIHTPLTNYHQHSGGRKAHALLQQLQAGQTIALVSDAGMPGIADPGHELIRSAIAAEIPVIPIPGATAFVAALAGGGLPTHRFAFEGFPPRDPAARQALFESLRSSPHTLVFYESPRRLRATLRDLLAALGDRRAVLARDLTKPTEQFTRGTLSELTSHFASHPPAGQSVLLVEGSHPRKPAPTRNPEHSAAPPYQPQPQPVNRTPPPSRLRAPAPTLETPVARCYNAPHARSQDLPEDLPEHLNT